MASPSANQPVPKRPMFSRFESVVYVSPPALPHHPSTTPASVFRRPTPELVKLSPDGSISEPKAADLHTAGFLTPTSLFYTRSIPNLPAMPGAADWKLRVRGLVDTDHIFTIVDLARLLPVVSLPVTLVSSSNRAKEQNILGTTLSPNSASGSISTALFTGVYLSSLLSHVQPAQSASHVHFTSFSSLDGCSQRLSRASNLENGMLLAWNMNGKSLSPQHGGPLRLIVPGQIGERSIQCLSEIELASRPSSHPNFEKQNKLLPSNLVPPIDDHHWHNSHYELYEASVSSAIAKPSHDEILEIPTGAMSRFVSDYDLAGWAYSGGGRSVNQVEVSFDNGKTWERANV